MSIGITSGGVFAVAGYAGASSNYDAHTAHKHVQQTCDWQNQLYRAGERLRHRCSAEMNLEFEMNT